MFNANATTVNSIVHLSNELTDHVLQNDDFFNLSLLNIIENTLGVRKSLIVIHGSKENDYRCCAFIDKSLDYYEIQDHPYWNFSRQDRCANHINDYCRNINMNSDSVEPIFFKSTEIIDKNEYNSSEYAKWLLNNLGQRYFYSLHLPFGPHGRYHLCFYKSEEQSDFTEQELDIATSVYSLVANAYRVFEHNSILKTFDSVKSELLDNCRLGYVVLDSRFNVINWNRTAVSLLSANGFPFSSKMALQELLLTEKIIGDYIFQPYEKKLGNLIFKMHKYQDKQPYNFEKIFYCLEIDHQIQKVEVIQPHFETLTTRENEITDRLSKGLTNREIADALFISPHTVRNHVQNIFQKLEIKNQRQLVSLYTKFAGVPPPFPKNAKSNVNFCRDKIICGCLHITAADIESLYRKGQLTMKSLVDETYLGSMCRNCVKEAADLLKSLSECG
jgi:DNA-binding CsgD family transcriptional regulator/bacterioferritin-associated ferredoxin